MYSDEKYEEVIKKNPNLERHPDFLEHGTTSRDFKSNKPGVEEVKPEAGEEIPRLRTDANEDEEIEKPKI
jgi:hypothetical protein